MKNITLVFVLALAFIAINLWSCSENPISNSSDDEIPSVASPNILFIIADDLGKDAINGFTEGSIKPITPHLDAIRNNGLSFSNFWSNPTCSPTRASIITANPAR